jgi:hypothetical protein
MNNRCGEVMREWWKKNRDSEVVKRRNELVRVKTKRTQFKKGRTPWNKGLKGYNLSIQKPRDWSIKNRKIYSKKMKRVMNTKEIKEKLRDLMEKRIKEGRNLTMFQEGANHPNWLNGKSFEPYDLNFNKQFKSRIKERDIYSCAICNSQKKLCIHHIDYDKSNTAEENCITLCSSCHAKTNKDRECWEVFFNLLFETQYGWKILKTKGEKDLSIQLVL